MSIVCKFGGSSMANAVQFKKVKDIVLSNNERKTESNTFKLNKNYFPHSPRFTEYMISFICTY